MLLVLLVMGNSSFLWFYKLNASGSNCILFFWTACSMSAVSSLDVYMISVPLLSHHYFLSPAQGKRQKKELPSLYSSWCIIYFSTGDWGLCPQYFSSNQDFRNYRGSLMEACSLNVVLKWNLKYFFSFFLQQLSGWLNFLNLLIPVFICSYMGHLLSQMCWKQTIWWLRLCWSKAGYSGTR